MTLETNELTNHVVEGANFAPLAKSKKMPFEKLIERKVHISSTESPQILIIEDNLSNIEIIQSVLKGIGYVNSLIARSSQKAINTVTQKIDLILMDIWLPEFDLNPTELCKYFKNHALCKHIPVIGFSIFPETFRENCLAAGFDDYFRKPITAEILKKIIEKWVPKKT